MGKYRELLNSIQASVTLPALIWITTAHKKVKLYACLTYKELKNTT